MLSNSASLDAIQNDAIRINDANGLLWMLKIAKEDVFFMLEIVRNSGGYFKFQSVDQPRLDVLQERFEKISID